MLRINLIEVRQHPRWLILLVLSATAQLCGFFSFEHPLSLGVTFVQAQSSSASFSTNGNSKTSATTAPPPSNSLSLEVIELTSSNFATTVNDGNVWLIEFYTSWCAHCQNFKASYDNVATTFHSSPQEKIRVAKVDCSVEKALATRFGVRGYPSFYLVSGWNVYEFDEGRSESSLISFARGGYKKKDSIPWMVSPMGPMGILQGTLIYVGTGIVGFFEFLQTKYSIPPVVAGVVCCMIGVVGGMISIVLLTILSSPREKVD